MPRKSNAISDELLEKAKESLKLLGKSGDSGRRLQAIISAKSKGIKAVSEIFGITRKTLMSWISSFASESIEGLKIKPGRGRKRKFPAEYQEDIHSIIKEHPNITIDELRLEIIDRYDINLGRSTVYRLMKRLSFSYITPRPRHYKSNKTLQKDFKKKSKGKN